MPTLSEFISSRRVELQKRIKELQDELGHLDELTKAIEENPAIGSIALKGAVAGVTASPISPGSEVDDLSSRLLPGQTPPQRKPSRKPTIKKMATAALERAPSGLTAEEIIRDIAENFGVNVPRSSMSPQLSRLKSDGIITWESSTKKWNLVDQRLPSVFD